MSLEEPSARVGSVDKDVHTFSISCTGGGPAVALHTPGVVMTRTCPATMSISWTSNLVSELLLWSAVDFASLTLASSEPIADALQR